jgi:hypothetical protein
MKAASDLPSPWQSSSLKAFTIWMFLLNIGVTRVHHEGPGFPPLEPGSIFGPFLFVQC